MILSAFALAGCGGSGGGGDVSNSKYVGTWKADSMSIKDVASESVEEDWVLELKADGTGTLTADEEVSNFTWSLTDGGFSTKGDLKVKFKDDGDNIKTNIIGVDLSFKKQQ